LSQFTNKINNVLNIKNVVDIGAGEVSFFCKLKMTLKGYISHFLVKDFKMNVVATEGNASYAENGEKRVQQVNDFIYRSGKRQQQLKQEAGQTYGSTAIFYSFFSFF
jgi:hypothetical protein